MRIRLAVPDKHVTADVLDAALEATTRANSALLAAGQRPTVDEMIRSGAVWKPESFTDGEHFDLATEVAKRGWGDCDDWAPALASDLRAEGDVGAHAFVQRSTSAPNRWHALVRTGDGEVLDPSVWAGMRSAKGARPAVHGPMCVVGQRGIVCVPHRGRWLCRVDTPWDREHVSSISGAEDINEALDAALAGAMLTGAAAGLPDTAVVGDVGSFLSDIVNTATSVIPGGGLVKAGAGMASNILDQALGKGGGGGGGGAAAPTPLPGGSGMQSVPLPGGGHLCCNPSTLGPIIVRF